MSIILVQYSVYKSWTAKGNEGNYMAPVVVTASGSYLVCVKLLLHFLHMVGYGRLSLKPIFSW